MRSRRTTAAPERPRSARFGPEPIALFPLVICVIGALPAATTWPALAWLPLLPVVAAVWVLRAGVVLTADRLEYCNGLARHRLAWDEVEGFDVPDRGVVRLLHHGRRTPLTAVPRREAARLVGAAQLLTGSSAA